MNQREGEVGPFATVRLRNDGLAEYADSKTGTEAYFHWSVQGLNFRVSNSYTGWLGAFGPLWNSTIRMLGRPSELDSDFEVLELNDDSFRIQQTPKSTPIWFRRIRD